jgi:hypothetical protein
MTRFPRRALFAITMAGAAVACGPNVRAAVSLKVNRDKRSPRDAGVWIDEQFIGQLSYVAAYGVRLPVGEHRITIEKSGYFPWDRMVTADREPIVLDVVLEPIPD